MEQKRALFAFLRGINVGGHHKVPMATLRKELTGLGLQNVRTLLNSGNVVFETENQEIEQLQVTIETHLYGVFGFAIPVILCEKHIILNLVAANPFGNVEVDADTRLYVSFLKHDPAIKLTTPWFSGDKSYRIIEVKDRIILSVLNLSLTKTTKGMDELEKMFGKEITTRNRNTVLKIIDL